MKNIKVNKVQLETALTTNREKHVLDYTAALEGYWKALEQKAETVLRRVKERRVEDNDLYIMLPKPESHEADYDTALEMLEWHEGDTIEVSQTEFKQFVQDEWSWKRNFENTTIAYSGNGW